MYYANCRLVSWAKCSWNNIFGLAGESVPPFFCPPSPPPPLKESCVDLHSKLLRDYNLDLTIFSHPAAPLQPSVLPTSELFKIFSFIISIIIDTTIFLLNLIGFSHLPLHLLVYNLGIAENRSHPMQAGIFIW